MLAIIPLFPLIGFLVNGIWYILGQSREGSHGDGATHGGSHGGSLEGKRKSGAAITGGIATFAIFLSFIASLVAFFQLCGMDPEHRVITENVYSWIQVSNFKLDMAFRLDSLSTLFTLVITGVGTLIHIYSIGYMSHDGSPGKFFCYLNLFCFAMLMLVLGGSLPVLFFGWEGVGLCSYLLIGFWYQDEEKAKAGKKAFIVNRIGDFGFLLGMFLIFSTFGTLDFEALKQIFAGGGLPAGVDVNTITMICLLLFIGCTGKSAQIPLYVWLPDAMAGPTPVSALIHAATMVTSGIYLISRLNFMFSLSPTAMSVVATVGVLTAFFAATIAVVQTDIKKVLAYSTISQLGFMFLGCGVGAYSAGVFHVITHAFFKALLFLGAGSVIHGMHEEQNIMKMGGLREKMPRTFVTFAIGWLAISGIPPLSGFFSKDEILWQSYASPHGSVFLWAFGAITAVMTAFYMTRLFYLTFLGEPRHNEATLHVHESPYSMVGPLLVLGVLSALGGFIGFPHFSWIEHWLDPVIPAHGALPSQEGGMEWLFMLISVLGACLGIYGGFRCYKNLNFAKSMAERFSPIHKLLENKWYVDEIYQTILISPIRRLSSFFWQVIDIGIIDWIVLSFARVSTRTGEGLKLIQTGAIQVYALVLLSGILLIVGYLNYGQF